MDTKKKGTKPNETVNELPETDNKDFWGDAETHVIDTKKAIEQFDLPARGHRWLQQGPFLICKSCPIEHSIFIGVNKRLVGYTDDNEPILKSIDESD